LNLLLSEKAGINIQENVAASKPLEEFIRQFTTGPSADAGNQSGKTNASSESPSTTGSGKKASHRISRADVLGWRCPAQDCPTLFLISILVACRKMLPLVPAGAVAELRSR
jgi:hypothetical protein